MAEQIPAPRPLSLEGNNLAENWRRWRQQYELYMTATEKDSKAEKLQCATFLALAGEAAIEVFNTFSIATAEKDKIAPLIEKFEEYLKNCEYGELTESIIKDRIVEGINNDSTRERLLREKDLSLQKAIDICKAAEVASQHMKTLVDSTAEAHAISKKPKGKFQGKEYQDLREKHNKGGSFGRCGYVHTGKQNQCPAIGQKCHKCGKINHFAKMCKNSQKTEVNTVEE
eukprot:Seg6585.1 transcript_id=Seg6585.1/GoldUCD/mRNA.D3Y31 product="hypothetical protein" protein_id=Seg6585.1/GoldUCD/D3Y31